MLLQMAEFPFSYLNDKWCICIILSISNLIAMFWLFWIILQQTWGCLGVYYLFEIVISFPFYPEIGLLDHIVILFLICLETSLVFSILAIPMYILPNSTQGLPFLHILSSIFYLLCFLIIAILNQKCILKKKLWLICFTVLEISIVISRSSEILSLGMSKLLLSTSKVSFMALLGFWSPTFLNLRIPISLVTSYI